MAKTPSPRIFRLRSAALCGVAAISAAAIAAVWLQLLETGLWQAPLSLFGAGALVGLVWDTRVRATRRLLAVVDLYAEQEIAREVTRRANAGGRG